MKKLVITKKRRTEAFARRKKEKRRLIKAAAMFMAAGLVLSGSMTADASALSGEEESVSYVYHKHIGNETAEGGCYRQPVYHIHTGDEAAGGDCYQTPVYHAHAGDEETGGACYATVHYHVHEGDGNSEEGCYRAVTHSHSEECYERISSGKYGCHTLRTVDTDEGDYEGHDYKYYYMSCGQVVHGTNSSHMHEVLNCTRGSEVTGYELGCGKSKESVDSYELSCFKTDVTVDAYRLSCEKNAESIDAYERNCGKDEELPCGKIVITKKPSEDKRKAEVKVRFEDLTGGELQLGETPFTWHDEQGGELGTGESITVSENGMYSVQVGVMNEDVKEESLCAKVSVNSIRKPVESKHDSDDDSHDGKESGKDDSGENDEMNSEANTQTEPAASASAALLPSLSPSVASAKKTIPENRVNKPEEKRGVTATPKIKKQTESVPMKERQSKAEQMIEVQTVPEKEGFFSSPLVRVLTVTLGTLAALAGLLLLLYVLRRSVKIYNDDGQENMVYLGRSMVRMEEDGYLIVITQEMSEKAVTNRYCIKPGLFRIGKAEEEILVERGQKRVSVSLQKDMPVII